MINIIYTLIGTLVYKIDSFQGNYSECFNERELTNFNIKTRKTHSKQ